MAKITDNSKKVLKEVDRLISQKLVTAAVMVERTAKEECPVLTGTLRRSITHEPTVPEREVLVGTNVEYAAYVELGTSKMAAQPYLRPALEANVNEIRKLFKAR